jgi:hypothetical protein
MIVHYSHCFSDKEQEQALDRLLADATVEPATLLMFQDNIGDRRRRERLRDRLAAFAATDAPTALWMANFWIDQKQPERAKEALLRAHVLGLTSMDPGAYDQKCRQLAEKLKIPLPEIGDLPEATLKELGVIDADALTTGPLRFTRRLGESLLLSTRQTDRNDGKRRLVILSVGADQSVKQDGGKSPAGFKMSVVEVEKGSRSSTTGGGSIDANGKWRNETEISSISGRRAKIRVVQSDAERFTFSIE